MCPPIYIVLKLRVWWSGAMWQNYDLGLPSLLFCFSIVQSPKSSFNVHGFQDRTRGSKA